ncbi:hypothetical protein [Lentzea sp.]|uniref:hypothetical protein n=1 Tax=Lentzea sp. TaxID=56099 RepID=UPI002CB88DA0|nr:hypothetical protein [Lentzea sp.]HUQ57464.1 hypothetical protein [Lentzea sp.]
MTRRWRTALLVALTGALSAALPAQAQEAADDLIHSRPTGAFALTPDWGLEATAASLQTAVGTTTSVAALLRDANRDLASCNSAQQQALPENYSRTDYPLTSGQILHSNEKYCWDPGDSKVDYWIPQGVTGSADADDDGLWGENRILLVSWHYDDAAPDKGVRISFVDLKNRKYRHVLLVEPTANANYKAVPIHAGGLAWLGHYLYVADTDGGLRVFDVERLLEVSDAQDSIGKSGSTYYAHNYKYVLPQVGWYRQNVRIDCVPSASQLCFSSLSLDRSTTPDTLVVGEYRDGRSTDTAVDGGRVVRYRVDASSRQLVLTDGKAVPQDVVTVPRGNLQGVQTWEDRYYLGRSSNRNHSWMHSGSVGGATETKSWAIGGEDLYHEHGTGITAGKLWTVTEHAWSEDGGTFIDRRAIFAVPLSSIG